MQHFARYLVLLAGLLAGVSLAAQRVSGTITDADGDPLIGASVLLVGTTTGTVTDLDGRYELAAVPGDSLTVSYTGYEIQTLAVGSSPLLDIELGRGVALNEIVVTSLGISREKKSLGYTVGEVDSEELLLQRNPNVVSALQGQVAGVQITQGGGGPGQAARIIIRGINSLDPNANNQPLFVVDGIPISNETRTAGGGAARNVSNRAADLNPHDIASVSILKGGAATALYGLRAANGAVIITTKRGEAGELKVNISTTAGFENINKVPATQKVYTQGYRGEYNENSFWPSWGPTVEEARAIDPDHPASLFNNFENAYETGTQLRTSVSLTGGSEKAAFFTSVSHLEHEGILPFSDYANTSVRIGGDFKASEKFSFGGSVNYINSGGNRVEADRFNVRLIYWAPQADVRDYQTERGSMRGYRFDGTVGNNPIYGEASNKYEDDVDRYIGNLRFTYAPTDYLRFNYLLGVDNYTDERFARAPGPQGFVGEGLFENNGLGFVENTRILSKDITSNITGILDVPLEGDLDVQLLAGFDVFDSENSSVGSRGEELDIFNLFSLNNAANITTESFEQRRRLLGLYGDLQLGYRNMLYLSVTGRNDWSSTLPAANRSFFYPSVSTSFVFSEMMDTRGPLDYGKVYASFAGIGKDTEPYRLATIYTNPAGFPIDGTTGWTRGGQQGSPTLVPERTNTYEFGVELRGLNNRARLNVAYYDATSRDQIIPVPVSLATGFSTFILNAGSIRNNGIELAVGGTPIETDDFTWDIGVNFTSNDNEVVEIRDGIEDIRVGGSFGYAGSSVSVRLVEGEAYGNIYGRSYLRQSALPEPGAGDTPPDGPLFLDRGAPIVIGDDGFPVVDREQRILGNTQPAWFGALNSTLTYKSLSLRVLFDTRQGVQKYNQLENFMSAFGISEYTLDRDETIVFDGVREDGTANTTPVFLGQGVGPDGEDYGNGFYRNIYRGVSENFVQDADWVRLRTASLTYALPARMLEGKRVDRAALTLTGNNLWLSTPFTGFDPEGVDNTTNGSDGLGGFTYPSVRSFLLTLDITL